MKFESDNTQWRQALAQKLLSIGEARSQNDVAEALRFFHPDAVYRGNGWKGFQNIDIRGHDALRSMMWAIVIEYELLALRADPPDIDRDHVAFRRTATLRNRGTGRGADVEICAFVRFHDNLIVEVGEWFDTLAMQQLNA